MQTEVSFQGIYYGMSGFQETLSEFLARGFHIVDFLPVSREPERLGVVEMDCVMARR